MKEATKKILVGITGPTGAGKSTVSALLRERGYTVIDCDVLARKAVEKGSSALNVLAEVFGADIINEDGTLDRKLLASRAFADKEQTEKLNAILHPVITQMTMEIAENAWNKGECVVFADAAALFESDIYSRCDFVSVVIAPRETRLERIMSRDGIDTNAAMARMSVQFDDEYYVSKSDFVIKNYAPYELCGQVDSLEERLKKL